MYSISNSKIQLSHQQKSKHQIRIIFESIKDIFATPQTINNYKIIVKIKLNK